MMTLTAFLLIGALLFGIGLVGILINRHNLVVLLMCIELLLLGVNTNFIAFSHFQNALDGQVFVFFILTVAAAEAAIGLSLLIVLYQKRGTIDIHKMDTLKG